MEFQALCYRGGLGAALLANSGMAGAAAAESAPTLAVQYAGIMGGGVVVVAMAMAVLLVVILGPGKLGSGGGAEAGAGANAPEPQANPDSVAPPASDGPVGYVSPGPVRYGYVSPYSDDELEET